MAGKTQYHNAYGYTAWAKVFESNRDTAEGVTNIGVKKKLEQTDGQYTLDFFPRDEETKEFMLSHLSDPMFGGASRFQAPSGDNHVTYGVGVATRFKRPHVHPAGFEALGGAPKIYHYNKDAQYQKGDPWDDGPIFNGAKIRIGYTTYGKGQSQTVSFHEIIVIKNGEKPEGWEDNVPEPDAGDFAEDQDNSNKDLDDEIPF